MNNFTLIIPTHNRHNYLKRSVAYFKDLDANVIYCDSSHEKYAGELSDNVKYLHLPDKKFAEKILIALSGINTDFVAMCADDDFILIDSLYKGLDFLSDNKNYKTTVGKYIGFNEVFDGEFFPIYQKLPDDIELGVDQNAKAFFENYYMILWSMYDKKVLDKAFKIINEAQFHNDNYIELTIGACACYEGGIKFLKEIWGIREISSNEHWGNRHTPISSMEIAEINGDYLKFKHLVDHNTFVGCAELVMNSYLNGHKKEKASLRTFIGKLIPEFVKRIIRKRTNFKSAAAKFVLDDSNYEHLDPIKGLLYKNSSNK